MNSTDLLGKNTIQITYYYIKDEQPNFSLGQLCFGYNSVSVHCIFKTFGFTPHDA